LAVETAIPLAALVQNHNLTVEDLAVAVEMTSAQFLTGLRAGTIRAIDEAWIVVETLGEPVRIRRVVATRSLAVDVTGGSQHAGIPSPGSARSAFDNGPPMCRP
jgi:hypothetical protein